MGEKILRLRLDIRQPVGRVKRVIEAAKARGESFVEFFWAMFHMYEHNPQMFNARLMDKLIRFSNLYKMDIQALIEESLSQFVENNPVKFTKELD